MAVKVDFEAICRTCLGTDTLNPIFRNPEKSMRYSIAIFMIAGLKVEVNDGLPQNMCIPCINNLNNAIKYRKQCKDAETYLLQIKRELETTLPDTDNRNEAENIIKNGTLEFDVSIKNEEHIPCDIKDETVQFLELDNDYEDDKPLTHYVKDVSLHKRESKKKLKRVKKTESSYQTSRREKNQRANCNVCQKELSIRSIDRHVESCHPGLDESKVKCDLCDSRVTSEKMNRHVRLMHGSGNLKCRYCEIEFKDRQILVEHVTTCTAKKKRKPYKKGRELAECDVCQKVMQRASLRLHKAVKHKGLGPVCEHCGRKFGNSIRLNEHYRAKHGYEKFKCGCCDYQTASELAMRNHERRHRGEKPFVCEACGASFHAAYLLAQHKHSHRTERLFKCDQCPASFKSNNSLLMHKQSCHSNRTYICLLCSRTYTWRHYAVKHLRLVHQYKGKCPPVGEVKPGSLPIVTTTPSLTNLPSLTTLPSLTEAKLAEIRADNNVDES